MFLIIVVAYSKWLEVQQVNVATSRATIEKLRSIYAIHRLSTILVSDNGSNFCSEQLEDFLAKNGIKIPNHAALNHRDSASGNAYGQKTAILPGYVASRCEEKGQNEQRNRKSYTIIMLWIDDQDQVIQCIQENLENNASGVLELSIHRLGQSCII